MVQGSGVAPGAVEAGHVPWRCFLGVLGKKEKIRLVDVVLPVINVWDENLCFSMGFWCHWYMVKT